MFSKLEMPTRHFPDLAQQLLAERSGCDVIHDVVNRITVLGSGEFQLETQNSGTTITTKKVLLTTGGFTNARELLPYQLELKLDLYGITVLLVSSGSKGRARLIRTRLIRSST